MVIFFGVVGLLYRYATARYASAEVGFIDASLLELT